MTLHWRRAKVHFDCCEELYDDNLLVGWAWNNDFICGTSGYVRARLTGGGRLVVKDVPYESVKLVVLIAYMEEQGLLKGENDEQEKD